MEVPGAQARICRRSRILAPGADWLKLIVLKSMANDVPGRIARARRNRSQDSSHRIEIHEDIARFGTFTGADVSAGLKDVQNPGGPGVAEAQAALEKRG